MSAGARLQTAASILDSNDRASALLLARRLAEGSPAGSAITEK
jgi:hypothetical protein